MIVIRRLATMEAILKLEKTMRRFAKNEREFNLLPVSSEKINGIQPSTLDSMLMMLMVGLHYILQVGLNIMKLSMSFSNFAKM